METLLKLSFFKSLGFNSKENGLQFIDQNIKLKEQIEEKVCELDEQKYQIIEEIKNAVFPKYNVNKKVFISNMKKTRAGKISQKKEIQKQAVKEDLKAELLAEIKEEERLEKEQHLKKKYSKAYPRPVEFNAENINKLFISVINKIDNKELSTNNLIIIEKQRLQVEKAFELIKKAIVTLEKLDNEC
jgi:cytidylate kinase